VLRFHAHTAQGFVWLYFLDRLMQPSGWKTRHHLFGRVFFTA
jgi:hypothetical protein